MERRNSRNAQKMTALTRLVVVCGTMEDYALVVHNDGTLGPADTTLKILTVRDVVLEEVANDHVFLFLKSEDTVGAEMRIVKKGLETACQPFFAGVANCCAYPLARRWVYTDDRVRDWDWCAPDRAADLGRRIRNELG